MDNSRTITLSQDAEETTGSVGDSPILKLTCYGSDNYDMAIDVRRVMSDQHVRIRLDNAEAESDTWDIPGHDGGLVMHVMYVGEAEDLIRKLSRSHIFKFEFTPYLAPTAVATFDVAGLQASLSKFPECATVADTANSESTPADVEESNQASPADSSANESRDNTISDVGQEDSSPEAAPETASSTGVIVSLSGNTKPAPIVRQDPDASKLSKQWNSSGLQMLSAVQPNLQAAQNDFKQAMQLDGTNIEALNNLGYTYGKLQNYGQAEAVLDKVVVAAPTRQVAQGNLGYVLAKEGKLVDASEHYCQYVRLASSFDKGKSDLTKQKNDPDPQVQAAIDSALKNCAE